MLYDGKIWIGSCENGTPVYLLPSMANRHGLIAGATGTGKTVSLKVLAEGFSDLGVPVFLSDIKSDLSGMVMDGTPTEAIEKRLVHSNTLPIRQNTGTYTENRAFRSGQQYRTWVRC